MALLACRAAKQPLGLAALAAVERRFGQGAIMTAFGLGGVVVAVLAADALFIIQTTMVMMALAALGMAMSTGPGRPHVAASQALFISAPMALAIIMLWPWPWGLAAGLGVMVFGGACIDVSRQNFQTRTELLLVRERNRAERERMEVAVAHLNQAMAILDADLRVLIIDQRALALLGLESLDLALAPNFAELIASAPNTAATDDDRGELLSRASLLVAARQQFNAVLRLNDDRIVDLEFVPIPGGSWVTMLRDSTGERNAIAEMQQELRRCPLTGLPNQRAFDEELNRRLLEGRPVCLLIIDLDGFELVNVQFGHPVGDRMIRRIGFRLRTAEIGLFAARLGGDRFGILADIADTASAEALGNRLIDTVDTPARFAEAEVQVGAAIGYAMAPADAVKAEPLLRAANLALATAKAQRGNALCQFMPSLLNQSVRSGAAEARVRAALRAGHIDVAFQPIVELATGRVMSVKALVRWPKMNGNNIPPVELVGIAERRGLVGRLRELVIAKAAEVVASQSGAISLWLNVSPLDLRDGSIADELVAAMSKVGLPMSRLVLEVTETALMTDAKACEGTLSRLRLLGARVAMDDFGAGFSSLDRLRQLPINAVKISGTLLAGAVDDAVAANIFRLATGLGHSMNLLTIAEGVETSRDLAFVKQCGVERVQGYLLSSPVSAALLPEAIASAEAALRTALHQAAE